MIAADPAGFLAALRDRAPLLSGEMGPCPPGWIAAGADNSAALAALVGALSLHEPGAGPAYWATRAWSMLEWQPAALAVYAVHGFGLLPALDSLSLRPQGALVAGFRLGRETLSQACEDTLVTLAGAALRAQMDVLLADLCAVARLKPANARRLLADRILFSLLRVARHVPGLDGPARLAALSEAWLEAAGLAGQSRLVPITLSGGRVQMVVDRKTCCLAYRSAAGTVCDSCPTRQDDATRFARMKEYWEHPDV
ncbi:siderophore ferric iron reductase [Paroceanicella profunda]|uniref:Siderophore ferric iron reductase n=1 Tax=Paroceanicella profunda TaxID=2579971 RepID=A0A5B8FZL5_9RHOB|nr:siderophore ferric iron reductase [Paroceanicella profunda]QDL91713.1 siderophore ferric iron reductase [Paroceanicella profunda]